MEKTLMIIKPDAVGAKHIGEIVARVEQEGFQITGLRYLRLSKEQAEQFYAIHRERPFFGALVAYMTSGPVVVGRLEREGAVDHWRKVIGATDPQKADAGTIRKLFGTNIEANAVHGSDSRENGQIETDFFFALDVWFGVMGEGALRKVARLHGIWPVWGRLDYPPKSSYLT